MTEADGAPPPAEAPARRSAEPAPEAGEDWATRYKYLLADFENFRRRTERERQAATAETRAAVLRELLPLYEAIQSAAASLAAASSADDIRRGIDLIAAEWKRFLAREGVAPVAAVGEPFRSEEAEAVAEAPGPGEEGTVVEIVQQGYRFPGGLLRPAKVVVVRVPAEATAPAVDEDPEP